MFFIIIENKMKVQLYNSLTRTATPFTPLQDNTVRMYSCGPTVYNHAHIGNMRSFLFADLLQRVLRIVGKYKITWVMNITNIDDKTIRDSGKGSPAWLPEMGEQTDDPLENLKKLTGYYEKAFLEDIETLGINRKHLSYLPKATDFIPQMQDLIRKIVKNGYGYVSQGSVYFDVNAWRQVDVYGKLYKIDFDNFKPGSRVDSDDYEREQVYDFVLWKARKEGEPSWDFEINGENCVGRPGWHIECSVMERELLGLPFDIHTGGVDLKFPHHEDEIAQSKAGYGVDPTAVWCHNEFLEVEGQKMSKSLGNFYTIEDLKKKKINMLDVRYLMFSSHYRSILNFTFNGIKAAGKARKKVQEYIYDLFLPDGDKSADADGVKEVCFNWLGNDLHTPKALAELFTFINDNPAKSLNQTTKKKLLSFFRDLNKIFAVWEINPRPEKKIVVPADIRKIAEERFEARKNKDWAKSDELRDKLKSLGWAVKDAKDGYELTNL